MTSRHLRVQYSDRARQREVTSSKAAKDDSCLSATERSVQIFDLTETMAFMTVSLLVVGATESREQHDVTAAVALFAS